MAAPTSPNAVAKYDSQVFIDPGRAPRLVSQSGPCAGLSFGASCAALRPGAAFVCERHAKDCKTRRGVAVTRWEHLRAFLVGLLVQATLEPLGFRHLGFYLSGFGGGFPKDYKPYDRIVFGDVLRYSLCHSDRRRHSPSAKQIRPTFWVSSSIILEGQ